MITNGLKRVYIKACKLVFLAYEFFLALFQKQQSIAFTKFDGWEKTLQKSFRFTKHKVFFLDVEDITENKYDIIVPLNVADLYYLSRQPCFSSINTIPLPSVEAIAICDNKATFSEVLKNKGFGQYIPKLNNEVKFPYMLKKKIDVNGENSFIINNENTEHDYSHLIDDPAYFRQELISGEKEYATHILVKNKKIVHYLNVEYTFEKKMPIKGKDKLIYKKFTDCGHIELFEKILNSIEFQGLCCVNYKEINNHPYVFEVNPRFCGSLTHFFFSFLRHLD